MLDINKVAAYVQGHEGKSLQMYLDSVGKWTIGIGHNLTDRGITEDVCMIMFQHDLQSAVTDLTRVFPEFSTYPDDAKLTLIDMMFQLGIIRFCTFKKMIEAVKSLNWKKAAEEVLDSTYASQVPTRAKENAENFRRC